MHDPLAAIRNYRRLDERLGTAGQPTAAQFADVARAGFGLVVNLALPTSTGALPDERATVTALGMDYVHIPVNFDAPTPEDFARFTGVMDGNAQRKVFVHCALNYRVSAFMALYRVRRLGWTRDAALAEVREVWEPDAVWRRFLDEQSGAPTD